MTISTILFDVGGVIVRPLDLEAVWATRERLARQLGYPSGREMWNHFYESEEWLACKTGRLRHEEMWEKLLHPHGFAERDSQSSFVDELHAGEGMHPEMGQLIARLAPHYKLGILSNWDERLEGILDELQMTRHFDAILNSHRIGLAKPDEAAFRLALERLDASPEQVLFIDDMERNTRVAEAMGLHTHTFTSVTALVADLEERGILDQAADV